MNLAINDAYDVLAILNVMIGAVSVVLWIVVYRRNRRKYRFLSITKAGAVLSVTLLYVWITYLSGIISYKNIPPGMAYMFWVRPVFSIILGVGLIDALYSLRCRREDYVSR